MEEKFEKNQQDDEVMFKDKNRITLKWQEKTGEKECTYVIEENGFQDHRKLESVIEEEAERLETSVEMKMKKKKALLEFRCMMEDAILGNYLLPDPKKFELSRKEKIMAREISLWGVPLLPSKGHEGTDTVLLKFLKANNFKVHEAFEMLRNTLKWRQEYNADAILDEDLQLGFGNLMQVNSVDKEGHPLYYDAFGGLKEEEFYGKVLGTEENCEKFLRWRIQSMEKSIKQLSFREGGADSILQITDFKNSPGPDLKELRSVSKRALTMVQANYPEIVHKNIMINVPLWFYTSHYLLSKFLSPKNRRKSILVRPSKVTKTLLKHISPEHLAVEYGGLRKENDADFSPDDKASELKVRQNTCERITIPVTEAGVTIVWDYTVVGWDVSCKEEFVPEDECSYRILIRKDKDKKVGESARNSFYINEPGKIVISIHNVTLKKKTVYYRSKAKPTLLLFNK